MNVISIVCVKILRPINLRQGAIPWNRSVIFRPQFIDFFAEQTYVLSKCVS